MNSDEDIELSFVLPCLNEAVTIRECVEECWEAIREAGIEGEVVVADNGSEDGSVGIARQAGARVVPVVERGYGNALMEGVRAARGRYVVMGDSDMSYNFREMPRFLDRLREGGDLVVGCRMPRGGGRIEPGAMPFLHRWLGNPVLSWLGRLLFRVTVTDFHCGMRGFRRDAILGLELRSPGMEFASEMVVRARMAGLRIAEVPVTLRKDGRNGRRPHLRTWSDGWRHLRFLLLHAPRWLLVFPGAAIGGLSLAAFLVLLAGPVRIGGVSFESNSLMLAQGGFLVGFQIVLMGLFAEVFSMRMRFAPGGRLLKRVLATGPFEKGLIAGGALVAFGCLLVVLAVLQWRAVGFGDLEDPVALRLVAGGVACALLGVQVLFAGFAFGCLGCDGEDSMAKDELRMADARSDSGGGDI